MSEPYTYDSWVTGREEVLPHPSTEAIATIRLILACDEYGPLHITVSDGNVADNHLTFCAEQPNLGHADLTCLAALRALPYEQREAAWHAAAYGQVNPPEGK